MDLFLSWYINEKFKKSSDRHLYSQKQRTSKDIEAWWPVRFNNVTSIKARIYWFGKRTSNLTGSPQRVYLKILNRLRYGLYIQHYICTLSRPTYCFSQFQNSAKLQIYVRKICQVGGYSNIFFYRISTLIVLIHEVWTCYQNHTQGPRKVISV